MSLPKSQKCLFVGLLLVTAAAFNGIYAYGNLVLPKHYQDQRLLRRKLGSQRRAVAQARSSCPSGCSAHGVCNEELSRCDCPRHYKGPACATAVPTEELRQICSAYGVLSHGECLGDLPCFNNCNGKGECVAGICHCEPGYWGADCAISWGPGGKPQLLDGKYTPRKTGVKIYIYELPANLTTWFSFTRQDRPIHTLFWQRVTASGMRTLDGNEADYFFIPINTRGGAIVSEHLLWGLDYIKRAWPWWSKDGGHRHLLFTPSDTGFHDLNWETRNRLGDTFTNLTLLTHWGLVEDRVNSIFKKAHRSGKDIVVPAMVPARGFDQTPLNPANAVKAQQEGRVLEYEHKGTLFFAGSICGNHSAHPDPKTGKCSDFHTDYSLGVRQAVYFHHHKRKDFTMVVRSSHYTKDIASHKFCLAPVGGGYGKRQMHSIFMGCVPVLIGDGVLQPFEPEMDWGRFSVSVAEADIPRLPVILKDIPKEAHAAMHKRLLCAAQHLFYSSSMGSIFGDDGRYDAFETLMEILRVRRAHPAAAPEEYRRLDERFRRFMNCDLDGEVDEPAPLCTYGRARKFPDRPACDECRTAQQMEGYFLAVPGGMLCCDTPQPGSCPAAWP